MKHSRRCGLLLLFGWLAVAILAQPSSTPLSDPPNPYRTVRDWGQPPNGAKWAAVTAVEAAPDGSIYVLHRCLKIPAPDVANRRSSNSTAPARC